MEKIMWTAKRSGAGITVDLEFETNGAKVEQKHTDVALIEFAVDRIIATLGDGSQIELPTTSRA